jgi:DNA adenine methylase
MEKNLDPHKPCLKWAGNKFRVLSRILPHLPKGNRLIEPFAGSAALSLNTQFKEYWLNDVNEDLIHLYENIIENPQNFIEKAKKLFSEKNNSDEAYYRYREKFNRLPSSIERSILFLYLNRHAYNGLCRYNKKGKFNAPFGDYKKPYFPAEEIKYFAEKNRETQLTKYHFNAVMESARPGDVVYCDPPYAPLSATANFTAYHTHAFSIEEQEHLAELALHLAKKKIPVIISNHDTTFTRELYQHAKIIKFTVPRFMSCQGDKRFPAKELLGLFLP